MAELSEYIFFALALSSVLGLISSLSHPSLAKEAEAAIGILCLFSLASPIAAAIPRLLDLPRPEQSLPVIGGGGYIELSEAAFADGIREYISGEFSLDASEVAVDISDFDFTAMRAGGVTVRLRGTAALSDIPGIREAIKGNFTSDGGECKVVIDVGG